MHPTSEIWKANFKTEISILFILFYLSNVMRKLCCLMGKYHYCTTIYLLIPWFTLNNIELLTLQSYIVNHKWHCEPWVCIVSKFKILYIYLQYIGFNSVLSCRYLIYRLLDLQQQSKDIWN
jgi:hypothetical protein